MVRCGSVWLMAVIEGNIQVHEGAPVDEKNTIILTKNEAENGVLLRLPHGDHGRARAAVLAGPPLDQVAYTRGPFVMTNREDAYAAVEDFNHARNGFEHAKGWKSEIGELECGGADGRSWVEVEVPEDRAGVRCTFTRKQDQPAGTCGIYEHLEELGSCGTGHTDMPVSLLVRPTSTCPPSCSPQTPAETS